MRVRLLTHSAGGLTTKDVALAQQISAAARELGIEAETDRMQELMLAVTTPDPARDHSVLEGGHGVSTRSREGVLFDADGRGPLIWFQPVQRRCAASRTST